MEIRSTPIEAASFQAHPEQHQIPLEGQEVVVYRSTAQDSNGYPKSIFDQYPNAEKGIVGAKLPMPEVKKRGGIDWTMMELAGESEGDDDAVVERMYGSQIRAEAKLQAQIAQRAEQERLDQIARVRESLSVLPGGKQQEDQNPDIRRFAQSRPRPALKIVRK